MSQDWEQGRYISLLGEPIGPDGKPERLVASFYKAADVKAVGVSTVLSAAFHAAIQTSPEAAALNMALGGLYHVCNMRFSESVAFFMMSRLFMHAFSMEDMGGKCIDMRPDPKTPPTLVADGTKAWVARLAYWAMTGIFSLVDAASLAHKASPIDAFDYCARQTIDYTRSLSGFSRFDKVLRGEWAIVDRPNSVPTREKTASLESAALRI